MFIAEFKTLYQTAILRKVYLTIDGIVETSSITLKGLKLFNIKIKRTFEALLEKQNLFMSYNLKLIAVKRAMKDW